MNRIPKSWLIYSLERSYPLFGMMIGDVSQQEAQTLRDGPDGWSILEIVCHVRDYQDIFLERVERMVAEDHPTLTPYDAEAREALITQNQYAQQNLKAVYQDYVATRHRFIALVTGMDEAQLARTGNNPLTGIINPVVTTFHTIMHDVDHTEQIARVRGMTMPDV